MSNRMITKPTSADSEDRRPALSSGDARKVGNRELPRSGKRTSQSRLMAALLFLMILLLSGVSAAALFGIGQKESSSSFLAEGPGGLRIVGEARGVVDANENDGQLIIRLDLRQYDTGIGFRDDHLRDALETKKFPFAELRVPRAALKFPADGAKLSSKATGSLKFHGKTKQIAFGYDVNRTGSDYHVGGKLKVDITQFGIEQPCHLGLCVKKDVKVKVKFKVREK
ncbi:MAG: YceI family protein [Polyangiaceae bacterium]|nr:YceI family protein [Polyangiaceae bacterium]